MFLITNLSNVNTKSCLRNQTRLCIHLVYSYLCSPTKNPKINKWGGEDTIIWNRIVISHCLELYMVLFIVELVQSNNERSFVFQ